VREIEVLKIMSQNILEALEMYASRDRQLFVKVVRRGLNETLGSAAAETLIYYLGGNEALHDPSIIVDKFRAVLGIGADTIFKHIIREMEKLKIIHFDE
jgi:hypothetical protein